MDKKTKEELTNEAEERKKDKVRGLDILLWVFLMISAVVVLMGVGILGKSSGAVLIATGGAALSLVLCLWGLWRLNKVKNKYDIRD